MCHVDREVKETPGVETQRTQEQGLHPDGEASRDKMGEIGADVMYKIRSPEQLPYYDRDLHAGGRAFPTGVPGPATGIRPPR